MTRKRINLFIDAFVCLVFLPMVIMLLPMEKWFVHSSTSICVVVTYVYLLYFTYRRINLSKLVLRKKYLLAAASLIILITVTEALTYAHFDSEYNLLTEQQIANRQGYRHQIIWFFFLIVSGFSLCIELAMELSRQIMSRQEMEARKDKAELMLYKSHINPHFLFNTLNTLYALVISRSDNTESAFVKFSNILRYTYTQARQDMIPIADEIEYISQYIDLQKLRLNNHTKVNFNSEIDNENSVLPPMIFITFIENAFKYGTSSEKDCEIRISITLTDGLLTLFTENMRMRNDAGSGTGVGIDNCRKRLDLIYGDRYKLDVTESENVYRTNLTINM